MKQQTIYIFLIICCVLSTAWFPAPYDPDELEPAEKLVIQIQTTAAEKLFRKYNLIPIGVGSSRDCVTQQICLSFDIFHTPLKREEVRKLLIECAHDFLEEINSYSELAEYAPKFPFDEENIEIEIGFWKPNGEEVDSSYVNFAGINTRELFYYINEGDNGVEIRYKETYAEALKLLREE